MNQVNRIVLLHTYSRRNSGDGLLVDLSMAMLRDAFGEGLDVSVVAADPGSFPEYRNVAGAPVIADQGAGRLVAATCALTGLPTARGNRLRHVIDKADLILGVGGGYLRARNGVEALKLELGHMLQMRAARASGKPAVYLPQSIGPAKTGGNVLSSAFGTRLTKLLGSFHSVFVRDDRSMAFLAGNDNTLRAPDLAILEFGRRHEEVLARAATHKGKVRHVALVLREAPSWGEEQRERYAVSTRRLISLLQRECRLSFAVQSTGRGNDDAAYYQRMGIGAELPGLRQLLEEDTPDVVVSVRLHGALESILHGVPAFHLSYERKGFGAYYDLNVRDWVANAADFDAERVVAQIFWPGAVSSFWQSAARGLDWIRDSRASIVETLRRAAASA